MSVAVSMATEKSVTGAERAVGGSSGGKQGLAHGAPPKQSLDVECTGKTF